MLRLIGRMYGDNMHGAFDYHHKLPELTRVKTTLEIPDDLLKSAKSKAQSEGRSLPEYVSEAIREKVSASAESRSNLPPVWTTLAGRFGKTDSDRDEIGRIQERVDAEFGQTDPLE